MTNESFTLQFELSIAKTFLTYDFVHVLKNITNNWINLKNYDQCFVFPSFEDFETVPLKALFNDIRNFYKAKCENCILKTGFKLNYKTVYPNNIERQKVSLGCQSLS